jgi:hypothetical protein
MCAIVTGSGSSFLCGLLPYCYPWPRTVFAFRIVRRFLLPRITLLFTLGAEHITANGDYFRRQQLFCEYDPLTATTVPIQLGSMIMNRASSGRGVRARVGRFGCVFATVSGWISRPILFFSHFFFSSAQPRITPHNLVDDH